MKTLGLLLLPLTSGFTETYLAIKMFSRGIGHYARAIGRIIGELSPDVLVADFSFPGACVASESRHLPYAVVYHAGLTFKGPGIPPFGSGLPIGEDWGRVSERYRTRLDGLERRTVAAMTRARRRLGITTAERPRGLSTPASPWLNLVLTAEACEAPRSPLPDTTFFVGPCTGTQSAQSADFPFARLSADRPKVYASLGTVFNNKPVVFRRIIEAFADGQRQLIVSAGRACAPLRSVPLPSHVLMVEQTPQVELLPRIDAVISHGGNNTVNETLMAGKPLLVMPVGGEQADNASRVVYLGAGLRADLRRAGGDSQHGGPSARRTRLPPPRRGDRPRAGADGRGRHRQRPHRAPRGDARACAPAGGLSADADT